jgi:hypothetical protein
MSLLVPEHRKDPGVGDSVRKAGGARVGPFSVGRIREANAAVGRSWAKTMVEGSLRKELEDDATGGP